MVCICTDGYAEIGGTIMSETIISMVLSDYLDRYEGNVTDAVVAACERELRENLEYFDINPEADADTLTDDEAEILEARMERARQICGW